MRDSTCGVTVCYTAIARAQVHNICPYPIAHRYWKLSYFLYNRALISLRFQWQRTVTTTRLQPFRYNHPPRYNHLNYSCRNRVTQYGNQGKVASKFMNVVLPSCHTDSKAPFIYLMSVGDGYLFQLGHPSACLLSYDVKNTNVVKHCSLAIIFLWVKFNMIISYSFPSQPV